MLCLTLLIILTIFRNRYERKFAILNYITLYKNRRRRWGTRGRRYTCRLTSVRFRALSDITFTCSKLYDIFFHIYILYIYSVYSYICKAVIITRTRSSLNANMERSNPTGLCLEKYPSLPRQPLPKTQLLIEEGSCFAVKQQGLMIWQIFTHTIIISQVACVMSIMHFQVSTM